MKKWIVVGLSIAVAGTGSTVFAATPEPAAPNSPVVTNTANLPASVIDDIAIPYEVVTYAQLEYQGYAITHAYKKHRNGQPAYQLQITRDDTGSGHDGHVLWYDLSWKLLGHEKMTKPIIIKKEEPKPQPEAAPTPPPAVQPQPNNGDNGGRGGVGGDDEDDDEEMPDDNDENDDNDDDADDKPQQGSFPFNN